MKFMNSNSRVVNGGGAVVSGPSSINQRSESEVEKDIREGIFRGFTEFEVPTAGGFYRHPAFTSNGQYGYFFFSPCPDSSVYEYWVVTNELQRSPTVDEAINEAIELVNRKDLLAWIPYLGDN